MAILLQFVMQFHHEPGKVTNGLPSFFQTMLSLLPSNVNVSAETSMIVLIIANLTTLDIATKGSLHSPASSAHILQDEFRKFFHRVPLVYWSDLVDVLDRSLYGLSGHEYEAVDSLFPVTSVLFALEGFFKTTYQMKGDLGRELKVTVNALMSQTNLLSLLVDIIEKHVDLTEEVIAPYQLPSHTSAETEQITPSLFVKTLTREENEMAVRAAFSMLLMFLKSEVSDNVEGGPSCGEMWNNVVTDSFWSTLLLLSRRKALHETTQTILNKLLDFKPASIPHDDHQRARHDGSSTSSESFPSLFPLPILEGTASINKENLDISSAAVPQSESVETSQEESQSKVNGDSSSPEVHKLAELAFACLQPHLSSSSLRSIIEGLGIHSSQDIISLTDIDVSVIAAELKPIPRRKFLSFMKEVKSAR
jgi:hypothetical protein